ncbi:MULTISPECIES: Gfo/Idh/MocA family oxidoreductase [unclassified Pseudomonas]|uniref:Gfo/Idh/MocA family oxidoreductase n=1 Tax=unclassified Pseudomonas TaxID=196821 RepID=UPI0021C9F0AA|nr:MULTISPECIES: Gfo/Idh/MocA family oxidoreductase [unclassified Pseudomonas]MCU1733986.1 Gfo/Idh/MocA family oxidoreductase [Pseudomonas sp. 20P_3.2_Bac4]MCU1742346.1 Gfo/Idh/MocA family oxidoreductase [Pseudomonas sp. 20P_3.2_Bac5]
MFNILLVGAGQLGSRHLQALALADFADITIQVVDPFAASLERAKERWEQVERSSSIRSIDFLTDIAQVKGSIDFCVVATNADCRLQLLEDMLARLTVRNLLLEKVLFQSEAQLNAAAQLFDHVGCNVWVNCPRRMFSGYEVLRERLSGQRAFDLRVVGEQWGLACNAIHFIDIWAFLSGATSYVADVSGLDPVVVESKRPGYKELIGTLAGNWQDSRFSLTCHAEVASQPLRIEIETEDYRVTLNEGAGLCELQDKASGAVEALPFTVLYQSQLTHRVAESIYRGSPCQLTTFDESAALHAPFLRTLLAFFNTHDGGAYTLCPIT